LPIAFFQKSWHDGHAEALPDGAIFIRRRGVRGALPPRTRRRYLERIRLTVEQEV